MIYLFLTILSFGLTSVLLLLLVLEMLSWWFCMLFKSWTALKYLMIQSMIFMLLLSSLFWFKPLFMLGLLIKMGLPPFHSWIIRFLSEVGPLVFVFTLTLHKVIPLIIFMKTGFSESSIMLVLISAVMAGFMISSASNMMLILSLSSMLHTFWMILGGASSVSLLLFYFLIYSSLLCMMVVSIGKSTDYSTQNSFSSFTWLMLSGMPPFAVFWGKAYIVSSAILLSSIFLVLVLMVLSVLTLTSYYRIWHFSILCPSETVTKSVTMFIVILSILTLS